MLYSINWPNFIVWLPLLLEILGNMCIVLFENQVVTSELVFWMKHFHSQKCSCFWFDFRYRFDSKWIKGMEHSGIGSSSTQITIKSQIMEPYGYLCHSHWELVISLKKLGKFKIKQFCYPEKAWIEVLAHLNWPKEINCTLR